jgi:drug/metabolite transporter (DMT)-like permease
MLLGALILSVGLVILIIYFALSKRSSRQIKSIAVIALIIVCLSALVSVAVYVLFSQPVAIISKEPVKEPVISEPPERIGEDQTLMVLIFAALFILLLVLIVYNALKERKRQALEAKKMLEGLPAITNREED